jgi:hypothetical protein
MEERAMGRHAADLLLTSFPELEPLAGAFKVPCPTVGDAVFREDRATNGPGLARDRGAEPVADQRGDLGAVIFQH